MFFSSIHAFIMLTDCLRVMYVLQTLVLWLTEGVRQYGTASDVSTRTTSGVPGWTTEAQTKHSQTGQHLRSAFVSSSANEDPCSQLVTRKRSMSGDDEQVGSIIFVPWCLAYGPSLTTSGRTLKTPSGYISLTYPPTPLIPQNTDTIWPLQLARRHLDSLTLDFGPIPPQSTGNR